ncbi:non-structural maintenance of chromosomes element 1 homolog isoform X2 [Venturia canescens]|nr:non-structural maintenance of chromosomes element 1 homolog isoform X2 [Venturia canescens]
MAYGDKHRTFVQILMQAGIMSENIIQQVVTEIFAQNPVSYHVAFINLHLDTVGFMIKSCLSELTGERYYMLTSTTMETATIPQTQFTKAQLEMLRCIYGGIIESPEGRVLGNACLGLCGKMENPITLTNAQVFLDNVVRSKWLDFKDNHYYIGPRSIMELMSYFKSTHDKAFNVCSLCKQTVFHGRPCEQCETMSHLYCLARAAKVQNPLKCSNCKVELPTDDLPDVPDTRSNVNDATQLGTQSSQTRVKRSKKTGHEH